MSKPRELKDFADFRAEQMADQILRAAGSSLQMYETLSKDEIIKAVQHVMDAAEKRGFERARLEASEPEQ